MVPGLSGSQEAGPGASDRTLVLMSLLLYKPLFGIILPGAVLPPDTSRKLLVLSALESSCLVLPD